MAAQISMEVKGLIVVEPKNARTFNDAMSMAINTIKSEQLLYSRHSEFQKIRKVAAKILGLLFSAEITDENDKHSVLFYFCPSYADFLSVYGNIDSKFKNSIHFQILICSQFEDACVHPDCISTIREIKMQDRNGLKKWLYHFGSALVFDEYSDVLHHYIESDIELLKMSLFAMQLLGLHAIKSDMSGKYSMPVYLLTLIPEEKKELWMYVISVWRHPDAAFNSLHPDKDFFLGHIPDEVQKHDHFKTALQYSKDNMRLPTELLS